MELKWSRQNLNSRFGPIYHNPLVRALCSLYVSIFKKDHTQVHQKIKQQISNNHMAIFGKNWKQAYGKFHGVSYKP